MNRHQKESVVRDINDQLKSANASFLIGYKGLSVAQVQDLRSRLRNVSGVFKVSKARLMKIAAKDLSGIDDFKNQFKDQVGLVFVKKDVPSVAKVLVDYSTINENLNIVAGFFESKAMSKDQIKYLASLPSREVLLAILAGTLQAPIASLARTLELIAKKDQVQV